jgi:hypothetical protein
MVNTYTAYEPQESVSFELSNVNLLYVSDAYLTSPLLTQEVASFKSFWDHQEI